MLPGSLFEYLERSASRYAERIAVVDSDGTTLTYGELHTRANRIAGFLHARHLNKGDRVALVLPKSANTVATILAVMKTGAAYVCVDRSAPPERIRAVLTDCQVKAVFAEAQTIQAVAGIENIIVSDFNGRSPDAVGSRIFNFADVLRHGPIEAHLPNVGAADLAYIIYTSGSTGVPKGVMLTHGNAVSFVEWCSETFSPTETDRFSSHAPFHFDLSILDLYLALKHGASIQLISEDLGKRPRDLASFIAQRKLTIWYSTPATLGLLADFGELGMLDCSSLRIVLFAGEVFPVKQLRRISASWPQAVFYNLYGPTETNVCTYAVIPIPVPPERSAPYPIGRPCSHCKVMVLGPNKEKLGFDEEGLLYVSGPSVFAGYWGRRDETAAACLEIEGTRWYNTGDVVRLTREEGLIYVGRRDRMVKRRGYRIELDEIEKCLHRHPAVASAAVIVNEAPETGTRIGAYLSLAAGVQRPSIIEMKSFCNRHLPAYMNPDAFIFLDHLPLTSTNKIDYRALARTFASGFRPSERAAGAK